ENIKTDRAVAVLRDAYCQVVELEDQDLIFEALCHQLSEAALPEISSHMDNEEFSSLIDIEQTAYGYFSILNLSHPEMGLWRNQALEREMHYRKTSNQESFIFTPPVRNDEKIGRNVPCPCGSGKKYKKCCGK
ncbi:MAG: SEC-C metal-binding domain-containing protein, partial [Bacillus sp. (in: firmicutes)]